MKKIFGLIFVLMILPSLSLVYAHGEETFSQAEEIIKQKISCDDLTDDQLEILGDYYLEQMHPGELHEIMDEQMGGEGSESLRQTHINMGLAFYCGEHGAFTGGMMDTMMGRGMMGNYYSGGMMGNSYYGSRTETGFFGWLSTLLVIAVLILLIVLIIKKIQKPRKR